MKNTIVLLFLSLLVGSIIGAESLPSHIEESYSNGLYSYSISTVYKNSRKDKWKYEKFFPSFKELTRFTEDEFSFTSVAPVSPQSFKFFLNAVSMHSGELPNWSEVNFLSRDRSPYFSKDNCSLKIIVADDLDLNTFCKLPRSCDELSISLGVYGRYTFTINSNSAKCMGHDRYSIRLFGNDGEVLWEELTLLKGDISFKKIYSLEDEEDRIYIHENNHGKIKSYELSFNFDVNSPFQSNEAQPVDGGQ